MKKTNSGNREVQAIASGDGLTYAQVARDPWLMERLIRDANRARTAAIGGMFAAVFHALVRVACSGRFSTANPAGHSRSTSYHAGRAAPRCEKITGYQLPASSRT